ncbi:MAG: threonine/serine exporter family protein [Oscillospiraceae bacterium]
MIAQLVAAFFGTVAFSLLFDVPKKYYIYCGIAACAGWCLYCVLTIYAGLSVTAASFFGTVLVVFLSRYLAVWKGCPVTIFLISGIFPLVPGGSIYWTAYYIVTGQGQAGLASGFTAIKISFAIVFGIVTVLGLPQSLFSLKFLRRKEDRR